MADYRFTDRIILFLLIGGVFGIDFDKSIDATYGGKVGNAGAEFRFSNSALDTIYEHALENIAAAIRSMTFPDVMVPIGGGMLTIKSVRMVEVKLGQYERLAMPPNRLRSRFSGARLVSTGQWQFKPFNGGRSIAQGIFRTIVVNAELNTVNQFARTWDAKPMVQTPECKAYLGQFRVEIEGFGENTTVIDRCDNLLCQRVRGHFEDAVCNMARNYIKDSINKKLATFPTRINLDPNGNRFLLDYSLLNGEPQVSEQYIEAALEGDVLSRGTGSANFYAPELTSSNDSRKMVSFLLSDFAFNTLFHQAHAQQFRLSAFDLIPASSPIKDLLKMNCSNSMTTPNPAAQRRYKLKPMRNRQDVVPRFETNDVPTCLGEIFSRNYTIIQYPLDSMGDLVFKTRNPAQILVRESSQGINSRFCSNCKQSPTTQRYVNLGTIEAYGPIFESNDNRVLLARADIQMLNGEFTPILNGCNITGSVNITVLELTQSTTPPASIQSRNNLPTDEILPQLSRLALPVFEQLFNSFLNKYAQFPVPILDGFVCTSPELRVFDRTMQVDCNVDVLKA